MTPQGEAPHDVLGVLSAAANRQRDAERRCLDVLVEKGFQLVRLPVLEEARAESDHDFRFVGPSGHLVALRTDFTPVAARTLAPLLEHASLPAGICYAGEVVRPHPARLRQQPEVSQLGFERYGADGEGAETLTLLLELVRQAGVRLGRCHLTVGVAGLAERILSQLLEEPPDGELVELLRARDLDALRDVLGVRGATLAALEDALLGGVPGQWSEVLGVRDEVGRLRPLLQRAAWQNLPASVEVAPRLEDSYHLGIVFSLWGAATGAVIAAGGEYRLALRDRTVPAAGATLALTLALEEAAC